MKIPLSVCLFTSTKGHFDIRGRYQETLAHLNKQIPLTEFANLTAHIKVSPGEDAEAKEMTANLKSLGFNVLETTMDWKHGDQSHQNGYLSDLGRMYTDIGVLRTPFCIHVEDDWLLNTLDGSDLESWFNRALNILAGDPNIIQVRIPRFSDEYDRINRLKAKHGIDARAEHVWTDHDIKLFGSGTFKCNDYSMNPSFFRTRDLRAAIFLMGMTRQFEAHVEHGFGRALRMFGGQPLCLSVLDPRKIKAAHIGVKPGEEDKVDIPLLSN